MISANLKCTGLLVKSGDRPFQGDSDLTSSLSENHLFLVVMSPSLSALLRFRFISFLLCGKGGFCFLAQ